VAQPDGRPRRTTMRRNNPRGHGGRLREDLVTAATALVAESGDTGGLSLRAVAARAGVAATSVYLHFSDLDEVKAAVIERGHVELARRRDTAVSAIADPPEVLLARCLAYARFAMDHPSLYRSMFGPDLPERLAYDADRSPGRDALDRLAADIAACQPGGPVTGDDPARLALLVWTALHGQVSLRIDRPHFPWPPLDTLITEAVRRLVRLD
jgi:AcrR family transcriptional regulator